MLKSVNTTWTCHESPWQVLTHFLLRQSKDVLHDLRNIPRYTARILLGIAAAFGVLSLWASHGDGTMPGMRRLSGVDPYCISSVHCITEERSAESRWKGLSPALAILDRVNPTIAAWVREKHANGLLVFRDDRPDRTVASAKYDMFQGRIVVRRELFHENDGSIAAILCHEYRHSRQNTGKFFQYVLSFLFAREGDLAIIENDALLYEQEARTAIFGNERSPERELAAWQRAVQQRTEDSWQEQPISPAISMVTGETGAP